MRGTLPTGVFYRITVVRMSCPDHTLCICERKPSPQVSSYLLYTMLIIEVDSLTEGASVIYPPLLVSYPHALLSTAHLWLLLQQRE